MESKISLQIFHKMTVLIKCQDDTPEGLDPEYYSFFKRGLLSEFELSNIKRAEFHTSDIAWQNSAIFTLNNPKFNI